MFLFQKIRELGIRLKKLPVTPYTAPELFRLTLLQEASKIADSWTHTSHKDVSPVSSNRLNGNVILIDDILP